MLGSASSGQALGAACDGCSGYSHLLPLPALTLCSLPAGTAPNRAPASRGHQPPTSTTRNCCNTLRRSKTSTWKHDTSEPGGQSSWTGVWSSEHPRGSHGCARLLGQGPGDGDTGCWPPADLVGLMAEGDGRALGGGLVFLHAALVDGGGPPGCATFSHGQCGDVGKGCRRRGPGESTLSSLAIGRGNSPLLC